MRPIDADALLKKTINNPLHAPYIVEKDIRGMPTIQPELKEGHWIWVAGELMCSECRTIYSDLYPDYDNAVACPHCGARMTTSK